MPIRIVDMMDQKAKWSKFNLPKFNAYGYSWRYPDGSKISAVFTSENNTLGVDLMETCQLIDSLGNLIANHNPDTKK